MTTPKGINRAVVVLKLPRPVPALIKYGRAIITAMTNNPHFPNPDPPLASVSAALDELQTTETATQARTHGAAAARAPRTFQAKPGPVSGSVKLVAKSAARRASYEWQYSADGGKTWLSAPITLQAKTIVQGLTPGATVTFRYRGVTKTGEGDWSQLVTAIVK